jgi:hypothetical protein
VKHAILFLFMISRVFGQREITGFTGDSLGGQPIAFASIGVMGKPIGTLSDEKGRFALKLGEDLLKDSIRFWAIGYKPVTFLVEDLLARKEVTVLLQQTPMQLEEVEVNSKKIKTEYLGHTKYTKNNCSGFLKNTNNWKGSEAAILAGNKVGRQVRLESFSFYVIQNKYTDSLRFRLMLYEASDKKWPRFKPITKKPVIFKLGIKQGEFTLDLRDYNIVTSKDFFISLECLMDEMDITQFCFAGSYSTPSFVKAASFGWWNKLRGGGGDFNVKVSYVKQ